MMEQKMQFALLEETFLNEDGNDSALGITIIIENDLKLVLDALGKIDSSYRNYSFAIANALIKGINKQETVYRNDELIIYEEELLNQETNQSVKGTRIMVVGKLKEILDQQSEHQSHLDAFGAFLKEGLNDVIDSCRVL